MATNKKNLVIAAVGDASYHQHWLQDNDKEFDLMLIYFDATPDKYQADADYYLQQQGLFKLENISLAIRHFQDIVKNYDAVCLPDDDLIMTAGQINQLFRIFHSYDLNLAQPAITGGVFLKQAFKQQSRYILRYVNWIDIMCPVFKTGILLDLLWTFNLNRSGWGVSLPWTKLLAYKKIAVIDSVGVFHGAKKWLDEPQRKYYLRLDAVEINPRTELDKIINDFQIPTPHRVIEYEKIIDPQAPALNIRLKKIRQEFHFLLYNRKTYWTHIKDNILIDNKKNFLARIERLIGLSGRLLKKLSPRAYCWAIKIKNKK